MTFPVVPGGSSSSGTVGSAPSVPLNPDGTPNLGTIPTTDGQTTIWNMPKGLNPNQPIWFGISSKTTKDTNIPTPHGYGKTAQPVGTPVTHTTSSQILKDPADIMKQIAAMSYNNPNEFLAIQKALASGPWGTVHLNGVFDTETENALGNAMLQYQKLAQGAGVGVSFTQYLTQMGQRAQQLGGGGTSNATGNGTVNQVSLTDPAQIRQAAQHAAIEALGQGLSEKQLDQFVSQFQSAQTAAQTSTASSATSPDLTGDALAFAEQQNPSEFKNNQRQTYIDQLVNMFAPSASQRPSMTPVSELTPGM